MTDSLDVNLVLSGATLIGIVGIGVRVWISGRERHIKSNGADHENIFARLGASEQRISTLEAHYEHTSRALKRMELKLDKLLEEPR